MIFVVDVSCVLLFLTFFIDFAAIFQFWQQNWFVCAFLKNKKWIRTKTGKEWDENDKEGLEVHLENDMMAGHHFESYFLFYPPNKNQKKIIIWLLFYFRPLFAVWPTICLICPIHSSLWRFFIVYTFKQIQQQIRQNTQIQQIQQQIQQIRQQIRQIQQIQQIRQALWLRLRTRAHQ